MSDFFFFFFFVGWPLSHAAVMGFFVVGFPTVRAYTPQWRWALRAWCESRDFAPGWTSVCFSKGVLKGKSGSLLQWGILVCTYHAETERGSETKGFHYFSCCHICFFSYRPKSHERVVTAWFVRCFLKICKHSAAGMLWVFAGETVVINCFAL